MFCLFSSDRRTAVGTSDSFTSFSLMVSLQTWQRRNVTKIVSHTFECFLRKAVLKVQSGTFCFSKGHSEVISGMALG